MLSLHKLGWFVVWVYIDDSGDPGFKFDSGSSTHLVIAACVFRSREDVELADRTIDAARMVKAPNGREYPRCREYKYSKIKDDHADQFFDHLTPVNYSVRAIILDKRDIKSEFLRKNPSQMKSHLIWQLLTHTWGQVKGATVVVDGQDTKAFGMSDCAYFTDSVNRKEPGVVSKVRFIDSKKSNLIQLADMTAGVIRRKSESCNKSENRYQSFARKSWQPQGSMWYFK